MLTTLSEPPVIEVLLATVVATVGESVESAVAAAPEPSRPTLPSFAIAYAVPRPE